MIGKIENKSSEVWKRWTYPESGFSTHWKSRPPVFRTLEKQDAYFPMFGKYWEMDFCRIYVDTPTGKIGIYQQEGSTNGVGDVTRSYIHKDHLGSVIATSDSSASITYHSYDAWGQQRDPDDWSPQTDPITDNSITDRGFTGHEMLAGLDLIHMNGRIYDPVIGRMISPDPIIQEPNNLQSFNRYAYVWNNPLSLTDPSGFVTEGLQEKLPPRDYENYAEPVSSGPLVGVGSSVGSSGLGLSSGSAGQDAGYSLDPIGGGWDGMPDEFGNVEFCDDIPVGFIVFNSYTGENVWVPEGEYDRFLNDLEENGFTVNEKGWIEETYERMLARIGISADDFGFSGTIDSGDIDQDSDKSGISEGITSATQSGQGTFVNAAVTDAKAHTDGAKLNLVKSGTREHSVIEKRGSSLKENRVGGHGFSDGSGPVDQRNGTNKSISAKDLSIELKNDSKYDPTKPVRLNACKTGAKSFAQNLANELGNTVYAPKGNLYAATLPLFGGKDGKTVTIILFEAARWETFIPQPRGGSQ